MAFLTSFMTGGLQRQLDRWGEQDAAIGERIGKIGEALVKADDNANEKSKKLETIAGILNSKYGKKGIYQLAFNVEGNAIDFNDDVDEIAKRVSEFELPEDYLKQIADPYSYLGEASQSMYDKDTQAYKTLLTSLNVPNKTGELFLSIPKRSYGDYYTELSGKPTLGAEPYTSPYPGMDKADIEKSAYGKLAFLVNNDIPLSEANNKEMLGEFALNDLQMNMIKKDVSEANTAEDILDRIMEKAAEDEASILALMNTPRDIIIKRISKTIGLENEPVVFSDSEIQQISKNPAIKDLTDSGYGVMTNTSALSDYQKNLPRVSLDFDNMDNNQISEILSQMQEGTLIEFIQNGQTYFIEY